MGLLTDSYSERAAVGDDSPYRELKHLLPKLAQPWWYRLVGYRYAAPDGPSVVGMTPDEKRVARREARKRFKRSQKAALATAAKRRASRRRELRAALKIA